MLLALNPTREVKKVLYTYIFLPARWFFSKETLFHDPSLHPLFPNVKPVDLPIAWVPCLPTPPSGGAPEKRFQCGSERGDMCVVFVSFRFYAFVAMR